MTRERYAGHVRVVGRNTEAFKRNRQIYDSAVIATDDYMDNFPGTTLELGTLDDMTTDDYDRHNLQLPLYMTECPDINQLAHNLSESMGTECFISFTTEVSGGESHASFVLHIDSSKARGAFQRELRRKFNSNWKYIVVLLLIVYFLYF